MMVISGGQSGADQAGLIVAKAFGFDTGGWIPKGFKVQGGYDTSLGPRFGLVETDSVKYPPRTRLNVKNSDATLILGDPDSRGCRLTRKLCSEYNRPVLIVQQSEPWVVSDASVQSVLTFVKTEGVAVLNVAGNREESYPGIGKWAQSLLTEVFKLLD